MSASSLFVTCGIMTQLRCRFAPEIFLMRDSGFGSIGPNFEKSTFGHGSRFSSPPPAGAAAATGAARWPVITPFTKPVTSSFVMRPFGPEPCTRATSTPSSRANLRTDGDAWLARYSPDGAAAGAAAAGAGAADAGAAAGAGTGAAAAGAGALAC